MASKKKRRTRQTADYLLSVRRLKNIVPSLKKFENRQRLKKSEKATIRRREKQLAGIPDLVPVTKSQAKKLGRRKLFLPGVNAVQLRGVTTDRDVHKGAYRGRIRISKSGDISVIQPEGQWIYWPLEKDVVRSRRGMRKAGQDAFAQKFPIEKLSDLTEKAFKQYHVKQVNLWAHAGIVGDGFESLNSFILWVNEKWQQGRYMGGSINSDNRFSNPSDPGKWVNGIAILIENPEYARKRKEVAKETKNKKLV